jgi:hypothetical protein
MAFPWGSFMIYSQLLAAKFGWPIVIIRIVLLVFLLLWSKLHAFLVWLEVIFKNGPFYAIKNTLVYPGNEDVETEGLNGTYMHCSISNGMELSRRCRG